PIDSDSFQGSPEARAASDVAPNLDAQETAITAASAHQSIGSEPSEPMSVRSPEKTKKIGRNRIDTRAATDEWMPSASSRLNDPAIPHRKPPKMEKTPSAFVAVAAANVMARTVARSPGDTPPFFSRRIGRRAMPKRPSAQNAVPSAATPASERPS